MVCASCMRLVRTYVTDRAERRRCHLHMVRSLGHHRRWFRLAMEPIEAIEPRAAKFEPWLVALAATLKRAVRRRIASAIRGDTGGGTEASSPKLPL
jgi:hypothetical protein